MASPVSAATIDAPTIHQKQSYDIAYLGLHVGKIHLWWEENDSAYKITAFIKTSGIARIFSKQKRVVELYGTKRGAEYVPLTYDAKVTYPHKEQTTKMIYQDGILSDMVMVPERENPLTAEQQARANDPLTAFLQAMHYIKTRGDAPQFFAMEAFDGKRLNRIYAMAGAGTEVCQLPCQVYRLHRKPLVGYNAKKLARYAKGEPPLFLHMNPHATSHFPLGMVVNTRIGKLTVKPAKD